MYKYYWAGFVNGKLDHFPATENGASYPVAIMPAIFKTKSEAKRRYQDVRKIQLKGTTQ